MLTIKSIAVQRLMDVPIAPGMTMYPVVIQDEKDTILVDCGDPRLMPDVCKSMAENGFDPEALTKIIITHHDYDHMGALSEFVYKFPHVQVMASPVQTEYIRGERRGMRLQEEDWVYAAKSPRERANMVRTRVIMDSQFVPAKVDVMLYDGHVLPYCGGIEVLYTEGHMPGHISLYVREKKALISGDAVCFEDGKLTINHRMEMNRAQGLESLDRMLGYDIESVYAFHGGYFAGDVRTQLLELRGAEVEFAAEIK